jgi:hypothetical protein
LYSFTRGKDTLADIVNVCGRLSASSEGVIRRSEVATLFGWTYISLGLISNSTSFIWLPKSETRIGRNEVEFSRNYTFSSSPALTCTDVGSVEMRI